MLGTGISRTVRKLNRPISRCFRLLRAIVFEQPTEAFSASDPRHGFRGFELRRDDPVLQTLMGTLVMKIFYIVFQRFSQDSFAQEHEMIQTVFA